MTVTSTQSSDSASSTLSSTLSTKSSSLGKDDFLKLLVAQLTHQDPLNPTDDTAFTAQLAQFSSLEQLTNISKGIDTLNSSYSQQGNISAVSYIGKQVLADGNTISKSDTAISTVSFTLGAAAASCSVNIYDTNGSIVKSMQLGAMQAGTFEINWDGSDSNGSPSASGVYGVQIAAADANGAAVSVSTSVSGTVTGVAPNSSGGATLILSDGRTVAFSNVKEVLNASTTSTTSNTSSN